MHPGRARVSPLWGLSEDLAAGGLEWELAVGSAEPGLLSTSSLLGLPPLKHPLC